MGIDFNPGKWAKPKTDGDGINPYWGGAWGNIISGMSVAGILIAEVSATDTMDYMSIINNTIDDCASSSSPKDYYAGISLRMDPRTAGPAKVKNNIIMNSRKNASTKYGFYGPNDSADIDEDYNNLYPTKKIYWSGSETCKPCAVGITAHSITGKGQNSTNHKPLFVDGGRGDFRLATGSKCVGSGVIASNTNYLPTSKTPITIQGKTYCSERCDDNTLNFAYGIDPASTFTAGSYTPKWSARSGSWDMGAVLYSAVPD
jgi:hypothetical protein